MSDRPVPRLPILHRHLEREIALEERRPAPDRFRVVRLKKLKLAIKDRIFRPGAPQPVSV